MHPKPYKTGSAAAPYPQYRPTSKRGLQGEKSPKMIPRNYKNAAYPATSGKAAERSVANAENEQETAA